MKERKDGNRQKKEVGGGGGKGVDMTRCKGLGGFCFRLLSLSLGPSVHDIRQFLSVFK